jgi:hypothetical protein
MQPERPPPIHVPTAVAAIELVREDVSPDHAPGLTYLSRFLLAFLVLGGLVSVAGAPGANLTPPMAWALLVGSVLAFALAGAAGRWWARARLRRRSRWVARSPHQWPGIWYETPRRRAMGFLIVFGLLTFALSRPSSPGGDLSLSAREALGQEVTGIVVPGAITALCGCIGALAWLDHRRFGTSRIVASHAELRGGEELAAVLEASPRLADAHEVRFELREKHSDSALGTRLLPGVAAIARAEQTVPASAFRHVPGFTLVPVTLRLPAGMQPSHDEERFGIHLTALGPVVGYRETAHVWELRAEARVGRALYRADFVLRVVSEDASRDGWTPPAAVASS